MPIDVQKTYECKVSGRPGLWKSVDFRWRGPVGEAWESGVIAGLAEKGLDLSQADRIIGTSAGAIVGARLASGMTPNQLAQAVFKRFEGPPPPPIQKPVPPPDLSYLVCKLEELNAGKVTAQSVGVDVGKWALTVHLASLVRRRSEIAAVSDKIARYSGAEAFCRAA